MEGPSLVRCSIALLFVLVLGACSEMELEPVLLELRDPIAVRGRQITLAGTDVLAGSEAWHLSYVIPFPSLIDVHRVEGIRFGVGTPARWTLVAEVLGWQWPDEFVLAEWTWYVEVVAWPHERPQDFEIFRRSIRGTRERRFARTAECAAGACVYENYSGGPLNDAFSFELFARGDPALEDWLASIDGRWWVYVNLMLSASAPFGPLPGPVSAKVPLVPTGSQIVLRR